MHGIGLQLTEVYISLPYFIIGFFKQLTGQNFGYLFCWKVLIATTQHMQVLHFVCTHLLRRFLCSSVVHTVG